MWFVYQCSIGCEQHLVQAMGEIDDLSDFQKGRIMRSHLAGMSVTLTAQLFGVLTTTNSLYDYGCIYKAWQDLISEEE